MTYEDHKIGMWNGTTYADAIEKQNNHSGKRYEKIQG